MTTFETTAGSLRGERASFVPTTFFAEFLAGAREGLEIEDRYHAQSRQSGLELTNFGLEQD
jgi:hypothetical protein